MLQALSSTMLSHHTPNLPDGSRTYPIPLEHLMMHQSPTKSTLTTIKTHSNFSMEPLTTNLPLSDLHQSHTSLPHHGVALTRLTTLNCPFLHQVNISQTLSISRSSSMITGSSTPITSWPQIQISRVWPTVLARASDSVVCISKTKTMTVICSSQLQPILMILKYQIGYADTINIDINDGHSTVLYWFLTYTCRSILMITLEERKERKDQ